ncbi:MBL fold metallo-hydrolase [Lactococcus fujiensis]|uniref:Metallo-beta-lactamase domain-containing protein n=1 Tax=Lactococcus fujiensis JCM 16395 TaxID=1291764 RepID=A0A2A5RM30_9LACT|nr:MBL fold metallo-hydrolase [Lactococcus fujiensis]PCS00364.1 hypothetical protein RT41_GL001251 [Lactococcus fujiensis JCM 16395]
MKIEKLVNPIAQENTYLLSNSSACMVIDPGSSPKPIVEHLTNLGVPLVAILLTHAHFDHMMGLKLLKDTYPDCPIYLHEAEKEWPHRPDLNASRLLMHDDIIAPDADDFYKIRYNYEISGFNFRILETPGHSIGGVSLVFDQEKIVFTGDALFKNAIGRWDLPTGNYEQLIHSIRTQLLSLNSEFEISPGHGPKSTIELEKNNNPFLK